MHGQQSALHLAASQSNVDIVEAVLKKFGIPDTSIEAFNPLSSAVLNNQHEIIKRLLKEPDIKKGILLY